MKIIISIVFILLRLTYGVSGQTEILKGKVVDHSDHEPLIGVNLLIKELKTGISTDINGEFELHSLPQGEFTLIASLVGHKTEVIKIKLPALSDLLIELTEGAVDLKEILITGNPFLSDSKDVSQSTVTISNLDLQIKSGSNIAQTLNYQPGISMRSNGSAASRPVIRGFSNNRILILENGLRMGDLSNTSDDHALSSDGSAPEKIEVLRGPASLLYGSNAIGGVINIITESIPNYIPHRLNGDANIIYSANNKELLGNMDMHYGYADFGFHASFFNRNNNDYRDAFYNIVENSSQKSQGLQFGSSFIRSSLIAGISFSNFTNEYDIPSNPAHYEEPQVSINMNKREIRFLFEGQDISPFFKNISLKGGYQDYSHQEVTKVNGSIGTSFGLSSLSADLSFKHAQIDSTFQGVIGLWGMKQNYSVNGDEAFTPNADYLSLAGYLFEQIKMNRFNLQIGGRIEINKLSIPEAIISKKYFNSDIKTYNTFSGSVGIVFTVNENISLFANLANAYRSPSIEELASYAVHEATYTFDIGNRNLKNENNVGFDFGFRLRKPNHSVELSTYLNVVSNYIFRKPTDKFFDPQNGNNSIDNNVGYPVYEYTQSDASIFGFEVKALYEATHALSTTVILDYVRGILNGIDENLPQIPPLRFSLEQRFATDSFWSGIIIKLTADQTKVAANETTTKGFGIFDTYLGVKFLTGSFVSMLNFKIENLFNQPYKDHLSAIKNFAYMPGRTIRIYYKFLF